MDDPLLVRVRMRVRSRRRSRTRSTANEVKRRERVKRWSEGLCVAFKSETVYRTSSWMQRVMMFLFVI